MSQVVLGVHHSDPGQGTGSTADGNVVVMVDGEPLFGIAQERVTRQKYDGGFVEAAEYALKALGLAVGDVDAVAVSTFGREARDDGAVAREVGAALGLDPGRVRPEVVPSHHLAHAFSAAAQHDSDRALVGVIDNSGSLLAPPDDGPGWALPMERTSWYLRAGDELVLIARDHDGRGEVGYGKAYSKVTRYVGFASYQEAGKTMALAAFGDPARFADVPFFPAGPDGVPRTAMGNGPDGVRDLAAHFTAHGTALERPRRADEPLAVDHLDLAAWCQEGLERAVCARMRGLAREHGVDSFAGAGGVFLNSVMNARLRETLGTGDVFVPPSPGDQGLALGAVAWWWHRHEGVIPRWGARPYLGGTFSGSEVRAALRGSASLEGRRVDDPADEVARAVAGGAVVGWFQGASEYGPRALGHRSILADPAGPWTRELLNNRVKHREWFRPYAPAVMDENVPALFGTSRSTPFMMHTESALPRTATAIPAGMHVDGSARLQTVSATQDPLFHGLLSRLHERHDRPAVINTSLNVDCMPIVESPSDALECFSRSPGMSALVIDDVVVTRRPGGGR